jgi:hypothetical protein
MVRQCAETFGKIDFIVNAAGMLRERMIWNMTEDDFDAVISVHLKGTWNMSHHAIKLMRGERFGRIVNFLRRLQGLSWPVQLRGGEGRHHRSDAHDCTRVRPLRHHGQRNVPVRRHPHDGQRCRHRQLEATIPLRGCSAILASA